MELQPIDNFPHFTVRLRFRRLYKRLGHQHENKTNDPHHMTEQFTGRWDLRVKMTTSPYRPVINIIAKNASQSSLLLRSIILPASLLYPVREEKQRRNLR